MKNYIFTPMNVKLVIIPLFLGCLSARAQVIKSIRTNLDDKTITIEYDADKTSVEEIIRGFKKISYEAREVEVETSKEDAL